MARWEPDARGGCGQAAMELYVERGYEQTTVAEIAERAGLTARTFFRHFADKREVLFAGSADAAGAARRRARGRAGRGPAVDAVAAALDAVAELLGERPRALARSARRSSTPTPSCRNAS